MKLIRDKDFELVLHWACEQCIVKPMCASFDCYMTDLMHCECLDCDKNEKCKEKCETVKRLILFENIEYTYGPVLREYLKQQIKEQSLFYHF